MDDEDQEMEELENIDIDLSNLGNLNAEERVSGNSDRSERRSRRNLGRRSQSVRNGERRRRQTTTSNVIREAAALGAALGRAGNARLRPPGHRMRQRRRQNQQETANNQSTEDSTIPNNAASVEVLPIVEPIASSMLPTNIEENRGSEDKNTEQSNSSWEDFSEEEVVGSADNSSVLNDNSMAEENEGPNGPTPDTA